MAIFGERKSKMIGRGYENDPIRDYVQSFHNVVNSVVANENVNYFRDPASALMRNSAKSAMKTFFIEGSADEANMSATEVENHRGEMSALYENNIEAIGEASGVGSFNAMVGLSLPMHKNILMNMVFDKGAIPKEVAVSPKFTRTMERRLLVKPDGTEIDMFLQQNELSKALNSANPFVPVELNLPEDGSTDVVVDHLNGAAVIDEVDVETYIGAIKIENVVFEAGDILPDENGVVRDQGTVAVSEETKDAWFAVNLTFNPGYGEIKRQLMKQVNVQVKQKNASDEIVVNDIVDVISGFIIKNRFQITSMNGKISAVRLMAKLDASKRTIDTPSVKWDEITDVVEIGTDEGINTTVSPEELKDISVLYDVNQLTKVMSLMKTVLHNRKDDKIKQGLDDSYNRLNAKSKFSGVFDFAPRDGYALDPEEWRHKTFFAYFDAQVQEMLYVLNDSNMSVSVFGDPALVRRITPTEYTYQAPANIGPVELDYTKTVCTSDRRVYTFVGSDKLRGTNELIVTLCPRNTNRVVYVIYDYQMYISNEIRQNNNPALPNICAFERFKFDEYQPVQGRIKVVNPTGIRPNDGSETRPF